MAGIPDLVFSRNGAVVAAECKRKAGWYTGNDCAQARSKGDTVKVSRLGWMRLSDLALASMRC
jgi:hypothetical protein